MVAAPTMTSTASGGGSTTPSTTSATTTTTTTTSTKKQTELEQVPEAEVLYSDCSPAARDTAVLTARLAYLAKQKAEILHWQTCAENIKKEMDVHHTPAWHCIVGSDFGSFVSHESKHVLFFSVGHMKVLIFKHG